MAKAPRPALRLVDRLVLLVAWLVTCGLVFVLGYYLGKGSPDVHAQLEERAVRLPVTGQPPPEGSRPKEAREFPSFYEALPAGERPVDVARGTPVTAPGAGATTTTVRPATATTTVPRTTTVVPGVLPPRVTTTLAPGAAVTTTLAPRAAVTTTLPTPLPRAVATTTVPTAAATPSTTLPRLPARGGFTVEASPTRSRVEAEQMLGDLRKRGYDATLVQMQRDGDTWYRLRVGRYATAEQATEVMRRLRDVEGVTHAFVAAE